MSEQQEAPFPDDYYQDDGGPPPAQTAQQIVRLQPSRMPIVGSIAKEFDVTPDQWRVLVDQIFPAAKSVEAVGMALAYCRARNLDIYKRPVHIVPMWSTALKRMVETVWPGIAEIRTTAHRTGNYAGIDPIRLAPMIEAEFEDQVERWENRRKVGTDTIKAKVRFPEHAEATVYRMVEGQRMPFTATVYWEEAYASQGKTSIPNSMWQRRPRGQLMKCAEAAALRMAFPEELGNTYAAEEMEGRTIDGTAVAHADPEKEAPKAPDNKLVPPPPDEPPAPTTIEAEANPPAPEATDDEPEALETGSDEWFAKLDEFASKANDLDDLESVSGYFELADVFDNAPADISARTQQIMDKARERIERLALVAAGQGDMLA